MKIGRGDAHVKNVRHGLVVKNASEKTENLTSSIFTFSFREEESRSGSRSSVGRTSECRGFKSPRLHHFYKNK